MYEAWLYSLNRAIQSWWCARQDLNLHACAMEPKSIVSANSTTGADISGRATCRYFVVLCFYTARGPRRSVTLDPHL